jgi:hypothetical protein
VSQLARIANEVRPPFGIDVQQNVLPSLISRRQRDAFISVADVEQSFHVHAAIVRFPRGPGGEPEALARKQTPQMPVERLPIRSS